VSVLDDLVTKDKVTRHKLGNIKLKPKPVTEGDFEADEHRANGDEFKVLDDATTERVASMVGPLGVLVCLMRYWGLRFVGRLECTVPGWTAHTGLCARGAF
jgi:hypothetical protein